MNSNNANAGLLTIENNKIDYKQLEIKYEVDKVIEEIEKIKYPFYKKILEIFYGKL